MDLGCTVGQNSCLGCRVCVCVCVCVCMCVCVCVCARVRVLFKDFSQKTRTWWGSRMAGRSSHILNSHLCCCSAVQSYLTFCDPMDCSISRLPCPRACSNSCPLSQWCLPTISSSVLPFSFCLPSFPASGSFLKIWLFASGGQSTGASASASVLLMNIQGWFPLGLTGWISLQSKGLSRVFSNTTFKSNKSSVFRLLYGPILTSIHDYWKNHSYD